ncbi:ABC transporter ATP-binding protein [Saccharopolyspora mangrovi]|uniref:ATP-binding cassette domain-containing protein n=1 Tax=Saccharopolyspora mangrovi TaxID=3082379 RepID=A0ABU6AHJ2_9PSEU|nr:ATP-binding cassette domain-containing protein [Saccharopolyspora sp. S2-29]MEB3370937.1 ATP-binding cassette domain-containing protein [Saccharopolyspora sp. S2-29]
MSAAGEVLFDLRDIERSYPAPRGGFLRRAPHIAALHEVDLTVRRGENLGIIGESGAGKSTLLRLITALDQPHSGSIHYRGQELRADRPRSLHRFRREVQMVFQDPMSSLDPRWSVRDIVAEPLVCLGIEGDHQQRVTQVLRDVELEPAVAQRRPAELSGGQRQRVALARAMAPGPEVLVADEPVSALDVSTRARMLELLSRMVRENGLTLVLVSHDLGVVRRLCDAVAILESGHLVEQGPVEEVFHAPRSSCTRKLIDAVPRIPS